LRDQLPKQKTLIFAATEIQRSRPACGEVAKGLHWTREEHAVKSLRDISLRVNIKGTPTSRCAKLVVHSSSGRTLEGDTCWRALAASSTCHPGYAKDHRRAVEDENFHGRCRCTAHANLHRRKIVSDACRPRCEKPLASRRRPSEAAGRRGKRCVILRNRIKIDYLVAFKSRRIIDRLTIGHSLT